MLSDVFARLGRAIARHPRATVLAWTALALAGLLFAVLGVHGQNLFDRLTTGAPAAPGSQSTQADTVLAASGAGPTLALAVQGADPTVDGLDAALAPARAELAAIPGVASVVDPLALPGGLTNPAAAPLVASDGHGFLVVVELARNLPPDAQGPALRAVEQRLRAVPADLTTVAPGASGIVGGSTLMLDAVTGQVEKDLVTGEVVAFPIALVVMVLVFGGLLAAAMPLVGAVASIAVGLAVLLGFSYLMELDASVVNVVTLVGLGLSIDYGLLIVSRFREELHTLVDGAGTGPVRRRRGDPLVVAALTRTMATAGRTVTFSALTVAISISGLLVFSPAILRAFGAAGVSVVLIALATALTLVPAVLTLLGRRLARPGLVSHIPVLRSALRHTSDVTSERGAFSTLAGRVQRHPWWVIVAVLAVLGLLASPVGRMELRNSTTQLLPAGSDQRDYVTVLTEQYPAASAAAVQVVAHAGLEQASAWATRLATLPGVATVDPPRPQGAVVVIGVRPAATDPAGPQAREVVGAVRALDAPFPVQVTGAAARQMDFTAAVAARAWWAVGIVVLATLVLLFAMTGSVVVPVKALLTNAASIGAALGVLVWVFQDGHLSGVLGFEPVGGVETYVVALVVAFAFGLAMDYEVFLLSRIKELVDSGVPNDEAVRLGLQRSGRVITSAAAIIVVVFAGFVAGRLLVIKEVGLTLAVAVLVDATLVRLLLVPATMTVLGDLNWWAPPGLRRWAPASRRPRPPDAAAP